MKLRKGEQIVCTKGHHAGYVTADIADGRAVSPDVLWVSEPPQPGTALGYVCGQCDEVVAMLEDGERWRVRTARGWVS